jgi:hypothetical protein
VTNIELAEVADTLAATGDVARDRGEAPAGQP